MVLDHLLLLSLPLLVLVLHLAATLYFFSVLLVEAIHLFSLAIGWFLGCIFGCCHNGLICAAIDCLLGFLVLSLRILLSLLFIC